MRDIAKQFQLVPVLQHGTSISSIGVSKFSHSHITIDKILLSISPERVIDSVIGHCVTLPAE
jgi:hypothetical protein